MLSVNELHHRLLEVQATCCARCAGNDDPHSGCVEYSYDGVYDEYTIVGQCGSTTVIGGGTVADRTELDALLDAFVRSAR